MKPSNSKLLAAVILLIAALPDANIAGTNASAKRVVAVPSFAPLLGAYFDGDRNLQIVSTSDGVNWTTIEANAYSPPPGDDLRDPTIIQIGDTLWVAYTAGIFGAVDYFSIIKSTDGGLSWTFVRNVTTIPGADHSWGPEWFVDLDGSLHVIIGVSTNGVGTDSNMKPYELHSSTGDPNGIWSSATALTFSLLPAVPYDNQVVLIGNVYHAIITSAGFGLYDFTSSSLIGPYTYSGQFTFNGSPVYGNEAPDVFPLPQGGYGLVFMHDGLQAAHSLGDLHTWSAGTPVSCTGGATVNNGGHFIAVAELALAAATSRKTHGSAGTFDIDLPLVGELGVECRTGGAGGNYTLVIRFNYMLVSGDAAVTSGIGTLATAPTFSANTMTVHLTGVTDMQKVTVTLSNVLDSFAQTLPDKTVSMNMLIGDANENKTVNASDIAHTKGQSGRATTAANFRTDINASGTVTASDIALVKANAGHTLP